MIKIGVLNGVVSRRKHGRNRLRTRVESYDARKQKERPLSRCVLPVAILLRDGRRARNNRIDIVPAADTAPNLLPSLLGASLPQLLFYA